MTIPAGPTADDFPTAWMGGDSILTPEFRAVLNFPLHEQAVARAVEDETRGGFPYLVYEIFWITDPVAHVLRVDEIVVPGHGDGGDDNGPNIREHERISLEKVEDLSVSLSPSPGERPDWIKFTGDAEPRTDLPVFLLVSFLNEPQIGYGRPGFQPRRR